jgi:hypothetical protein
VSAEDSYEYISEDERREVERRYIEGLEASGYPYALIYEADGSLHIGRGAGAS